MFAGGRAFAASAAQLAGVQKVDHASNVAASTGATAPSGATPRPGTLLFTGPVDHRPTIYVVGNDGALHGFATPTQLIADGYDPALVVTVPNLGGLSVGATAGSLGSAANALSTRADGAIVDSSGTFYVLAGGQAFGISDTHDLLATRAADPAVTLKGAVPTSATLADGVLVTVAGTVYVTYGGELYPFKSMAQLAADGHSGTASVSAPGTDGYSVASY